MKKKEKYSLTAKQRKDKRHQQEVKQDPSVRTEEELAAIEANAEQKKHKRNKILRLVAIITAAVLAVACITAGIWVGVTSGRYYNGQPSKAPAEGETKDVVNPLAVITLSNGQKIEIELNYKDCPAAVANFVYLSENKFYDDTMFHNSVQGFLAFSGYTSPNTHKAQDESYVAALKGFSSREIQYNRSNFKLGYRITTKNPNPKPAEIQTPKPGEATVGYMAFMSGSSSGAYSSSTSYLLIHNASAQLKAGKGSDTGLYSNLSYMGKINGESMKVIEDISKMEYSSTPVANLYSGGSGNSTGTTIMEWRYPQNYQSIMIKSVKITLLDKTLKKNILNSFEDFVLNTESGMKDAIKGSSISFTSTPPTAWRWNIMGNAST